MTSFIGDYPCKMDAKGRVSMPVAFKKQMDASAQGRFVVKKDIYEKCLILYPMDEWLRQIKFLRSKLNPYNKTHNKFLREFSKGMVEVVLDANSRILIPKRLLEYADIEKDVVLAGQDGKIEIWKQANYEMIGDDEEGFAGLADELLGGDFNIKPEE